MLVTVPRVSRSCEHFSDGFDLHLLHAGTNTHPYAPYSRLMPRALWWSKRGGGGAVSEVPLYGPGPVLGPYNRAYEVTGVARN